MGRGLIVDGRLRLRGWARIGVLASRLRLMLDEVLATRIDHPDPDLGLGLVEGRGGARGASAGGGAVADSEARAARREQDVKVINIVSKLVEFNGLDQ
jgi:ATP-dependent RNA helicase DHX57